MFMRPRETGRDPTEPENMYRTPATCAQECWKLTGAPHPDMGDAFEDIGSRVWSHAVVYGSSCRKLVS